MAVETQEQASGSENEPHDRISHMDLLNLWRGDMQALRADMDRRFFGNALAYWHRLCSYSTAHRHSDFHPIARSNKEGGFKHRPLLIPEP